MDILSAINEIRPLDFAAMEKASARQASLVKPAGSLGALEDISVKIAGITGEIYNHLHKKVHYLFGADNGVYAEGVASAPQEFTRILMNNYAEGGCGINVLCKQYGVDLRLVDVGIIGDLHNKKICNKKLMNGTGNIAKEPAMPRETAIAAMQLGFDCALEAKAGGYDIIGTGEVGMANTTTASACIMAALSITDAETAVGRGAGLTDEAYSKKMAVVQKALALHSPDSSDPIGIIAAVGGLDIAALTGLYIGAAYARMPVVVDGVISVAAALLAARLQPIAREYMIASHISQEPAYALAVDALGLNPMLNLNMRLGEGSGCPIAMSVIDASLSVLRDMHTFDNLKLPTDYQKDITA